MNAIVAIRLMRSPRKQCKIVYQNNMQRLLKWEPKALEISLTFVTNLVYPGSEMNYWPGDRRIFRHFAILCLSPVYADGVVPQTSYYTPSMQALRRSADDLKDDTKPLVTNRPQEQFSHQHYDQGFTIPSCAQHIRNIEEWKVCLKLEATRHRHGMPSAVESGLDLCGNISIA